MVNGSRRIGLRYDGGRACSDRRTAACIIRLQVSVIASLLRRARPASGDRRVAAGPEGGRSRPQGRP